MCHLQQHEGQAFQRLHGLTGRPAGDADRLMNIDDLTPIAEPPAALLIELPQRDLGGQQPDWPDLLAQAEWARDRGAAVHLDGARLWESAAGYGKPLHEIAALFDSVYVSFYKGIGALAGCCVAGPADILAEVREWRHRMGGTLFGLWPNAASALSCLRRRLPLMPEYLSHAREIAATLRDLAGVRVVPDPPQVPMMHLLLSTTQERFAAAARRLAIERRIWSWPTAMPTGDPGVQRIELSVGDATRTLSPAQVGEIIATLLALPRASALTARSPTRTIPGTTMRVFIPRSRRRRPICELTNRIASVPKRSMNFAQPVCGASLTRSTASPTASRLPAGRLSTLRSRSR
jgi:hypothetical protein